MFKIWFLRKSRSMVGIPENEPKLLEKNEIDDQMVQGLFKIGLTASLIELCSFKICCMKIGFFYRST